MRRGNILTGIPLTGTSNADEAWKNRWFLTNISLYLGNDKRWGHSYLVRNANRNSIKWCHFQWPWVTANPDCFQYTPLFDVTWNMHCRWVIRYRRVSENRVLYACLSCGDGLNKPLYNWHVARVSIHSNNKLRNSGRHSYSGIFVGTYTCPTLLVSIRWWHCNICGWRFGLVVTRWLRST